MPWEHVEGQHPEDIVLCEFGDSLGLTHRLRVIDLGVTNDVKELHENCQGVTSAGRACLRQSERRRRHHGEQLTLQRWIAGVETVLVTM